MPAKGRPAGFGGRAANPKDFSRRPKRRSKFSSHRPATSRRAGQAADRENLAAGVTYEAEVVCYDGSLYQALKDTAQVPGGSDWICLAVAGRDAITPQVRGTYKDGEQYKKLDIVALNGASFIRAP